LTKVLVPEAEVVSWTPTAFFAVRRHLAQHPVDCLVTSGPPDSTHLIGLLLGSRRPPWLADFRDGWCFEPLREPFPTRFQRALDVCPEHRAARPADVVVGATRPIAEDLKKRLRARAAYVPNGFDPPTSFPSIASRNGRSGGIALVHTGGLSGVGE